MGKENFPFGKNFPAEMQRQVVIETDIIVLGKAPLNSQLLPQVKLSGGENTEVDVVVFVFPHRRAELDNCLY